jgi:hypothetical protein
MSFTRPQVTDETLTAALEQVVHSVGERLKLKGHGAFVSHHEGLGIVTEEYHELVEAVRGNDPVDVANEAMDVAVGAIFIVASLLQQEAEVKLAQEKLAELSSKVVQD